MTAQVVWVIRPMLKTWSWLQEHGEPVEGFSLSLASLNLCETWYIPTLDLKSYHRYLNLTVAAIAHSLLNICSLFYLTKRAKFSYSQWHYIRVELQSIFLRFLCCYGSVNKWDTSGSIERKDSYKDLIWGIMFLPFLFFFFLPFPRNTGVMGLNSQSCLVQWGKLSEVSQALGW